MFFTRLMNFDSRLLSSGSCSHFYGLRFIPSSSMETALLCFTSLLQTWKDCCVLDLELDCKDTEMDTANSVLLGLTPWGSEVLMVCNGPGVQGLRGVTSEAAWG